MKPVEAPAPSRTCQPKPGMCRFANRVTQRTNAKAGGWDASAGLVNGWLLALRKARRERALGPLRASPVAALRCRGCPAWRMVSTTASGLPPCWARGAGQHGPARASTDKHRQAPAGMAASRPCRAPAPSPAAHPAGRVAGGLWVGHPPDWGRIHSCSRIPPRWGETLARSSRLNGQASGNSPCSRHDDIHSFKPQGMQCHPFAMQRLRDSPLFAVPYFEVQEIVPAIEQGHRRF